ncbi:MAG: polysaccharide biosynthesis protein [Bacillota bacterium]
MRPFARFRLPFLLILDCFTVNAAALAALYLRFEGVIPRNYIDDYARVAPYLTAITLLVFGFSGLYSEVLRYASIETLWATAVGSAASGVAFWSLTRYWVNRSFPRSVPIMAGALCFILSGGIRVSVRLFLRLEQRARSMADHREAIRVLIVGAGDAGAILGRELIKPATPRRTIVGYIDDDPAKKGLVIYGAKVLGPRSVLPSVIEEHGVEEVIIAMPSAPPEVTRSIIETCQGLRVKIRALPRLLDLANRNFELNMVREIEIEDLLGRPEVKLDSRKISEYLAGKTVLVTGAGGSIGSEICRQVASFGPASLVLLGHGENSIFNVRMSLAKDFPDIKTEAVIADIRDSARVRDVFIQYRPNVVFHAAAHKHVPLMEGNLTEALKTNVFGTLNVARAAKRYDCEKFVMISTDKAVNPSSIMGVSKRIAEMVVRSMNDDPSRTSFVSVRFGNVLGSSGSVVPIFKTQIASGGPVTVTHPEMKRYFMTIKEAVQLVLQAGTMGRGGEIFVLDMGKPVKIVDLAEQMIKLSGRIPYTEIPIVFSGVRPGEKLFEELLTAEEGTTATAHSQIYIAQQNGLDIADLHAKLARLEEELFPRDYVARVFDLSTPSLLAEEHPRDAIIEVASGLREAAPAGNGGDCYQSGPNCVSPLETGRYWGKETELLVLKSREQAIIRVLRDIVPAYDPLRNGFHGDDVGAQGQR